MIYELGKTYEVPCLWLNWPHTRWSFGLLKTKYKPSWWPILGTWHIDRELGNAPHHYHFDVRFLTDDQMGIIAKQLKQSIGSSDDADPIQEAVFYYVATDGHLMDDQEEPQMVSMECKRLWNPYVPGIPWLEKLEEMEFELKLKNDVCPHRGTDLSTYVADGDGCTICPLHGLKWHRESGKLVRQSKVSCDQWENEGGK